MLARLVAFDEHVRRTASEGQQPPSSRALTLGIEPFAKFPAHDFNYLAELDSLDMTTPATEQQLLDEVASFFHGAQRPESPYCLFNLNVLPTVNASAAACLSVMHNINGLMDMFSGESLLVEQKVARTIGRWAGWPQSMGIACNGGKLTMFYALRTAVTRAHPSYQKDGLRARVVVLCSAGAHYSVEHVAASIGIGASSCVRIPMDATGGMSTAALTEAMESAHAEGATIAAVVCCGGTVIDFCCDDTAAIHSVVDRFAREHNTAKPYLHFDSVIGWLYLTFRHATPQQLAATIPEDTTRDRIAEVTRRCTALQHFDSLGVDFHKTGLCPYASSFFIARDHRFMSDLGTGDYAYTASDFEFGNLRTYRYTIENSRPTHGVLSAWVNLRSLGAQGYGNYLVSLHRGRAELEAAIARHGTFTTLNRSSLGWEVVFDIPFAETHSNEAYRERAIAFMEHCWKRVRDGHELPLFSIVPEFHIDHDPARSRCAFLLYPMREHSPELWDAVIESIAIELDRFEDTATATPVRSAGWQKPIR